MRYLKISNEGVLVLDNLLHIASSTKRFKYIFDDYNLNILKDSLSESEFSFLKENFYRQAFLSDEDLNAKLGGNVLNMSVVKNIARNRNIGKYGTGLKQAYCYFLRENIGLKIFSDLTEFKISKAVKLSDGIYSDFVAIDGKVTDLNVAYAMGDYDLAMSIAEVWTNAKDARSEELSIVDESEVRGEVGRTCFYLEFNEDLEFFYNHWDEYFSFSRTDEVYTNAKEDSKTVRIFANPDGKPFDKLIVYRRGVQVYSYNQNSIFHYQIDDLAITGSRLVKSVWNMNIRLVDILSKDIPKSLIETFVQSLNSYKHTYESSLDWVYYASYNKSWEDVFKGVKILEDDKEAFYKHLTDDLKPSAFLALPSTMVSSLTKKVPTASHINGFSETHTQGLILLTDCEVSDDLKNFSKMVKTMLDLMGIILTFDIRFFKSYSENSLILSSKGIILISDQVLTRQKPLKELLTSVIIENEKLKKYSSYENVFDFDVHRELVEILMSTNSRTNVLVNLITDSKAHVYNTGLIEIVYTSSKRCTVIKGDYIEYLLSFYKLTKIGESGESPDIVEIYSISNNINHNQLADLSDLPF